MAAPLTLFLIVPRLSSLELESDGVFLAVLSGALTSGVGYAIWYTALGGHSATSAGIVQLAVPVLAAIAGVLFLAEELGFRFALASVLTLGGIAIAIAGKRKSAA